MNLRPGRLRPLINLFCLHTISLQCSPYKQIQFSSLSTTYSAPYVHFQFEMVRDLGWVIWRMHIICSIATACPSSTFPLPKLILFRICDNYELDGKNSTVQIHSMKRAPPPPTNQLKPMQLLWILKRWYILSMCTLLVFVWMR